MENKKINPLFVYIAISVIIATLYAKFFLFHIHTKINHLKLSLEQNINLAHSRNYLLTNNKKLLSENYTLFENICPVLEKTTTPATLYAKEIYQTAESAAISTNIKLEQMRFDPLETFAPSDTTQSINSIIGGLAVSEANLRRQDNEKTSEKILEYMRDNVTVLPFVLTISGNLNNTLSFIKQVFNNSEIAIIDNLEISETSKEQTVNANIISKFYFAKFPSTIRTTLTNSTCVMPKYPTTEEIEKIKTKNIFSSPFNTDNSHNDFWTQSININTSSHYPLPPIIPSTETNSKIENKIIEFPAASFTTNFSSSILPKQRGKKQTRPSAQKSAQTTRYNCATTTQKIPVIKSEPETFTDLKFVGMLFTDSGNYAMITLNGITYTLKLGDVRKEIKIVSIKEDSIVVEIKGVKKIVYKLH